MLGEGGYVPASTERSSPGCASAPTAHGILLVVDEIQTGFGRTGKFWGGDHFGAPAGHPGHREGPRLRLPALRRSPRPSALMEKAWPGSQGGTYGANAVACAAALATLDVIQDEKLVENSAERGAQLKEALQRVADRARADHRRPRASA